MELCHYRVAAANPAKRQIVIPDTDQALGASVLQRFAKFAAFTATRRINWSRSFALKGLSYEDYVAGDSFGDTAIFWRRAEADAFLPQTISFHNDYFAKGPLHGDVLCFTKHELRLTVDEKGFFEGPVAGPDTRELFATVLRGEIFGADHSQALRLHELLLPQLKPTFQAQFLNSWVQGESLLRFQPFIRPNAP
jgi:hypothetical protein